MKYTLRLLFVFLLFTGCAGDEEDINCSAYSPIIPGLNLRFVDASGNNLIENGSIDPENIRVESNSETLDFELITEDRFGEQDADFRIFSNSIFFKVVPRRSSFQFTITAENYNSVTVDFLAERHDLRCGISYYEVTEASSSETSLEYLELNSALLLYVINLEEEN